MKSSRYEISEDMSQRLNIMKFIFMVLVVFIHSEALPELPFEVQVPEYVALCKDIVVDGICAIAVPGFFFISGFLLFSKDFTWFGNLKKKVRSMIIPYVIINTFWVLFFKCMQSFEATAPFFAGDAYQIKGVSGLLAAYFNPIPLYYPFWFLRDLIILNIFARVIKIMIDKLPIISLIAIIALVFNTIKIPLLVSNESFCMFTLSYYLVKYRFEAKKIENVSLLIVGATFGCFTGIMLWLWNHTMIRLLFIIAGLVFFYVLAGKIRKGRSAKRFLWCSQFTFFIYAFHEFYEAMLKKIIMMIIPQYGLVQLVEFFVIPSVVIGACILVGFILKSYMPRVYGFICGSR